MSTRHTIVGAFFLLQAITLAFPAAARAGTAGQIDEQLLAPTINLVSAASRLSHSSAGPFDVEMPLSGDLGIECRAGRFYNAVFTFDDAVTSGEVKVIDGMASVGPISFSGNTIIAQLANVPTAEIVTLQVRNINGDGEQHGNVAFGFLVGDVNADGVVNLHDEREIRANKGESVDTDNFRSDLNRDQTVDSHDYVVWQRTEFHHLP